MNILLVHHTHILMRELKISRLCKTTRLVIKKIIGNVIVETNVTLKEILEILPRTEILYHFN